MCLQRLSLVKEGIRVSDGVEEVLVKGKQQKKSSSNSVNKYKV